MECPPSLATRLIRQLTCPAPGRSAVAHPAVKFRKRFDDRVIQIIHLPAEGAQAILNTIRKRWPWVKHLFADDACDRLKLMDKAAYLRFVIEIIRRRDDQKGLEVLPRRWVVGRTFGWMIRWRRLVRDYERRIDVSTAMIHFAMGGVLIRRNAHP